MSNPQIKYLQDSFRRANVVGIRHDFIFFLQLKAINKTGLFPTQNHLVVINSHIGLSKPSIRARIDSMINNDLAYRIYNKRGKPVAIQLRSYDHLWYDILKYQKSELSDVRGFKGCLKIYKIPTNVIKNKKDLLNHIYAFDCYKKLQSCRYKAGKTINTQSSSIRKNGVDLSQLSMALMFGFSSRTTACRIQKQLSDNGFLQVFHNMKMIDRVHIAKYKRDYDQYDHRRTIFEHNSKGYGYVKQRLCNSLWININHLFISSNNSNTNNHVVPKVTA